LSWAGAVTATKSLPAKVIFWYLWPWKKRRRKGGKEEERRRKKGKRVKIIIIYKWTLFDVSHCLLSEKGIPEITDSKNDQCFTTYGFCGFYNVNSTLVKWNSRISKL
jgi:hypothetical protein